MLSGKMLLRRIISSVYYNLSLHKLRRRGKVLILMYHRILPSHQVADMLIQPGMYVTDDTFDMQLNFLNSYCDIISFAEFLQRYSANQWDHNKRYCILTFDDGWKDNYTYAYPLIKKYHMPATIFLTTSYIGSARQFWPEELAFLFNKLNLNELPSDQQSKLFRKSEELKIKRSHILSFVNTPSLEKRRETMHIIIERFKDNTEETIQTFIETLRDITRQHMPGDNHAFLGWKEIEEMSGNKITFGSHCVSHRILTRLSPVAIDEEVTISFETLKARKVNLLPVLSYPNGNYNQDIIKHTRNAGYQAAVTTQAGWVDPHEDDLFSLERINIHNDISYNSSLFAFHISGAFN